MRVNPDELSLKDKVVFINRVAKVVKGGKRFNFCALVVVGDGQGWVGIGKGKAAEVPVAIAKAVQQAKKNLVHVPLKSGTIPHEVHGLFGGEHVLLKPAVEGTGIIAGGAVRAVVELVGAHNIISKTLGRGESVQHGACDAGRSHAAQKSGAGHAVAPGRRASGGSARVMTTAKTAKAPAQSVRITLKRSPIGTPERHRLVLRGLGLRKIRQSVVRPDTAQVRGLIHKVSYLLEVQPS